MLFGKLFLLFVATTGVVLHFKEKQWTDPTKFPGAQVIEEPVDAIDAWDDIEKCSKGRDRAFEKVQWVVADTIPFHSPEQDHVVAGAYIGQHHSIVILRSVYNLDPQHPLRHVVIRHVVIRHELMHLKQYASGHSSKYFNTECGTMNEYVR